MVSSAVVAQILEHSLVNPPRRVYRWLPTGYTEVPDMLLAVSEEADKDVE